MFNRILRYLFFAIFVRPLVLIILGLNLRHRERLPKKGPAIIIANHNSHLDTLVLMSLFPTLPHPIAAADYFLRNPILAWFALKIIGIIPIQRTIKAHSDPFEAATNALSEGKILILFPEGTRGKPEQMDKFKSGIAHLAKHNPQIPVIPIFLHGLGKALPKGETVFVPFFCDIFVGEALPFCENKKQYMEQLDSAMQQLAKEGMFAPWE
ncbi:lysophospholipid acyltransferase family protein [Candidatus Marithrix sp. Canyon 246]|uniref:lysophospholipid acyltransferase family protein n=1 Tax=Candidatus Marithrix sp. Canyon 246 TaxID=1827136 RepID=UPI000A963D08|nr:lysophospholipid acyltransferase family protein [Candidatus Marithrix sp. Canyon 246]